MRVPVFVRRGRNLDLVGWTSARLPNPWRTLRNKRRVFLDGVGRLELGLPASFQGVHVQDISELGRRSRELLSVDCGRELGYRRKLDFLQGLLDANPQLGEFLEATAGHGAGDMHLQDFGRVVLERRRPLSSWGEAFRASLRGRDTYSGAWARLGPLAEAVEGSPDWAGGRLQPPEVGGGRDACEGERESALDSLYTRARRGRLREEAPF